MTRTSNHTTAVRTSLRRVAVATLVAAAGLGATAGVAAAAPAHIDEVVFTAHAYFAPQPDGTSKAVLVGDTCMIASDGAAATRCSFNATGTLNPDGTGVATARLISGGRVIYLEETFSPTGPATGVGIGTSTEIYRGMVSTGTMVAAFELAPTALPNVLLDSGTITITH